MSILTSRIKWKQDSKLKKSTSCFLQKFDFKSKLLWIIAILSSEELLKPKSIPTRIELSISSKHLLLSRNESSPFLGCSFILSMVEQVGDGAATLFNSFSTALAWWTGCVVPKSRERYKINQTKFNWWLTLWLVQVQDEEEWFLTDKQCECA